MIKGAPGCHGNALRRSCIGNRDPSNCIYVWVCDLLSRPEAKGFFIIIVSVSDFFSPQKTLDNLVSASLSTRIHPGKSSEWVLIFSCALLHIHTLLTFTPGSCPHTTSSCIQSVMTYLIVLLFGELPPYLAAVYFIYFIFFYVKCYMPCFSIFSVHIYIYDFKNNKLCSH